MTAKHWKCNKPEAQAKVKNSFNPIGPFPTSPRIQRAQLFQKGTDIGELRLRVACDQLLTKSSRVASEELLEPSDVEGTHPLDDVRVPTTSAKDESQDGIQSNGSILLARK